MAATSGKAQPTIVDARATAPGAEPDWLSSSWKCRLEGQPGPAPAPSTRPRRRPPWPSPPQEHRGREDRRGRAHRLPERVGRRRARRSAWPPTGTSRARTRGGAGAQARAELCWSKVAESLTTPSMATAARQRTRAPGAWSGRSSRRKPSASATGCMTPCGLSAPRLRPLPRRARPSSTCTSRASPRGGAGAQARAELVPCHGVLVEVRDRVGDLVSRGVL